VNPNEIVASKMFILFGFNVQIVCFKCSVLSFKNVQIVEHSHRRFHGLERQYTCVVYKIMICTICVFLSMWLHVSPRVVSIA
jgi:hypothetical protein